MRAAMAALGFSAALFLGGCASFSPKPTLEDRHACELETADSTRGNSYRLFNDCMRLRGYTLMCGNRPCPEWAQ
jgi:hypothetical protein